MSTHKNSLSTKIASGKLFTNEATKMLERQINDSSLTVLERVELSLRLRRAGYHLVHTYRNHQKYTKVFDVNSK